jgi:hypothetical protein
VRFDVRTFVVGLAVSLLTGQLVGTASADVVVDNPVHYVALGRRARTRHCLVVSRFRSMHCGLIRRW